MSKISKSEPEKDIKMPTQTIQPTEPIPVYTSTVKPVTKPMTIQEESKVETRETDGVKYHDWDEYIKATSNYIYGGKNWNLVSSFLRARKQSLKMLEEMRRENRENSRNSRIKKKPSNTSIKKVEPSSIQNENLRDFSKAAAVVTQSQSSFTTSSSPPIEEMNKPKATRAARDKFQKISVQLPSAALSVQFVASFNNWKPLNLDLSNGLWSTAVPREYIDKNVDKYSIIITLANVGEYKLLVSNSDGSCNWYSDKHSPQIRTETGFNNLVSFSNNSIVQIESTMTSTELSVCLTAGNTLSYNFFPYLISLAKWR